MVAFLGPRVREIHVEGIHRIVLHAVAQEEENIATKHGGVGQCARLVHFALGKLCPSVIPFAAHNHGIGVLGCIFRKESALAATDFNFDLAAFCKLREHVFPVKVQLVGESVGCRNRLAVTMGAEHVMPQSL